MSGKTVIGCILSSIIMLGLTLVILYDLGCQKPIDFWITASGIVLWGLSMLFISLGSKKKGDQEILDKYETEKILNKK